jgi:hypothetical protein
MLKKLGRPGGWVLAYALVGGMMTAGYAYAAVTGWEGSSERGEVPPEVRHSQHGYRTFSYWHDHHYWYSPHVFFWSSGPYRGYRWGK